MPATFRSAAGREYDHRVEIALRAIGRLVPAFRRGMSLPYEGSGRPGADSCGL